MSLAGDPLPNFRFRTGSIPILMVSATCRHTGGTSRALTQRLGLLKVRVQISFAPVRTTACARAAGIRRLTSNVALPRFQAAALKLLRFDLSFHLSWRCLKGLQWRVRSETA